MAQVLKMDWSQFTNGRLTSNLALRQGIEIYKAACLECDNYIPTPQGPLEKRPGPRAVDREDTALKIVPFNFSYQQAYAMLFCSDGNLRIYKVDVMGSPVATISHPFTADQLTALKYTQSLDTLFLFTGAAATPAPEQLLKRGATDADWTFSTIPWGNEQFPPCAQFEDTSGITLTASAQSGSITLTASASLFDSTWVNLWIRIAGGWCHITSINSATVANASVPESAPFSANNSTYTNRYHLKWTGAIPDWQEPCTSVRRGYARAGTFHQGRLVFGGTTQLPQTLMYSRSNQFYDFDPNYNVVVDSSGTVTADSVANDDAIIVTLNAQQSHIIEQVYSASNALQIFTREGEWTEQSQPVEPTNISLTQTSSEGTYPNSPTILSAAGFSLFVDRTGMSGFSYSFNYINQNYLPQNISVISNQSMLTFPTASGLVKNIQEEGSALGVWCNGNATTANYGMVITTTMNQSVNGQMPPPGWSRWNSNYFLFVDFANVENRMYFLMKRKSDGAIFLTYLNTNGVSQQFYLDLAQTQTLGGPGTHFTGFSQFANTTVSVVADGYYTYSGIAVDGSGNFTLPEARTSVVAGYDYRTSEFVTMPVAPELDGQLQRGEHITLKKCQAWIQNGPGCYINNVLVRPRSIPQVVLGQTYSVTGQQVYEVERALFVEGTEPTVAISSMPGFPLTISAVKVNFQIGRRN